MRIYNVLFYTGYYLILVKEKLKFDSLVDDVGPMK